MSLICSLMTSSATSRLDFHHISQLKNYYYFFFKLFSNIISQTIYIYLLRDLFVAELKVSVFLSSEAAEELQPSSHATSSVQTMSQASAGAVRGGHGVPPAAAQSRPPSSAAGQTFSSSHITRIVFGNGPASFTCARVCRSLCVRDA